MRRSLVFILLIILLITVEGGAAPVVKSSSKQISLGKNQPTAELHVSVSSNEISVVDSLQMTITVLQPEGTEAHLPPFEELGFSTSFTERSQRFRVTNISEQTKTKEPDGRLRIQAHYTLEPWLSGNYAILPLMVSFFSTQEDDLQTSQEKLAQIPLSTLMTDGIRVTVTPLPEDRKQLSDILGQADFLSKNLLEKERRTENKSSEELRREEENKKAAALALQNRAFPWWTVYLILGVLVVGTISWFLGRGKGKRFFTKPNLPPHKKAFEALENLQKSNLLAQGKIKEFYYQLSFILREYIGGRYHILADRQTTEEFFQNLLISNPFDELAEQTLREFSDLADTVKYSLYRPDNTLAHKSFSVAQSFVSQTKPQSEEERK